MKCTAASGSLYPALYTVFEDPFLYLGSVAWLRASDVAVVGAHAAFGKVQPPLITKLTKA